MIVGVAVAGQVRNLLEPLISRSSSDHAAERLSGVAGSAVGVEEGIHGHEVITMIPGIIHPNTELATHLALDLHVPLGKLWVQQFAGPGEIVKSTEAGIDSL